MLPFPLARSSSTDPTEPSTDPTEQWIEQYKKQNQILHSYPIQRKGGAPEPRSIDPISIENINNNNINNISTKLVLARSRTLLLDSRYASKSSEGLFTWSHEMVYTSECHVYTHFTVHDYSIRETLHLDILETMNQATHHPPYRIAIPPGFYTPDSLVARLQNWRASGARSNYTFTLENNKLRITSDRSAGDFFSIIRCHPLLATILGIRPSVTVINSYLGEDPVQIPTQDQVLLEVSFSHTSVSGLHENSIVHFLQDRAPPNILLFPQPVSFDTVRVQCRHPTREPFIPRGPFCLVMETKGHAAKGHAAPLKPLPLTSLPV
jgi:hypothetical protein